MLLLLADDEGIEDEAMPGGVMQHRGGHGVGTEGEAAGRRVLEVGGELAHDRADEGCCLAVEGDAPQVDVVVGLPAARQGHLAAHDRALNDEVAEFFPGG